MSRSSVANVAALAALTFSDRYGSAFDQLHPQRTKPEKGKRSKVKAARKARLRNQRRNK